MSHRFMSTKIFNSGFFVCFVLCFAMQALGCWARSPAPINSVILMTVPSSPRIVDDTTGTPVGTDRPRLLLWSGPVCWDTAKCFSVSSSQVYHLENTGNDTYFLRLLWGLNKALSPLPGTGKALDTYYYYFYKCSTLCFIHYLHIQFLI